MLETHPYWAYWAIAKTYVHTGAWTQISLEMNCTVLHPTELNLSQV
jgi:hypothetical protein